jgi:hypothetical protein
MTGTQLRELFVSSEFTNGLEEMSSYLASIMQERPIVYLRAKCLWKLGHKFTLEDRRTDLSLNGRRIEFKFNFDRCEKNLEKELAMYGDNLANAIGKGWGVSPKIYQDVCVKRPHIFVWIICSRDLSNVAPDDLKRICVAREQCKYNATHPFASDGKLPVADLLLRTLHSIRPFSLLTQDIQTKGDFPSTYHFRICDFDTLC